MKIVKMDAHVWQSFTLYFCHVTIFKLIKLTRPGKSWVSFVTGTLVYNDGLVNLITKKHNKKDKKDMYVCVCKKSIIASVKRKIHHR